jgi:hypothetical protein
MTAMIEETLQLYNLKTKIAGSTTDSAAAALLSSRLLVEQQNGTFESLRCACHLLPLALKDVRRVARYILWDGGCLYL